MSDQVTLDDSDILRVVNRGEHALRVMYDSKETVLQPGADNFLSFPCVALWFGDPRASGMIGRVVNERGLATYVPDRETEVRRLRVKYDNQLGDENTIVKAPHVDVYTLQGDKIMTVLDDPRGDSIIPSTSTVLDQSNLLAIVAKQQAAIDLLTEMVKQQQGEPESEPRSDDDGDGSDGSDDEPTGATSIDPAAVIDMTGQTGTPPVPPSHLILPTTPQTGDAQPPMDNG